MATRREFLGRGVAAAGGLLAAGVLGCERGGSETDGHASTDASPGDDTTTGPDDGAEVSEPTARKNLLLITVDQMRALELLPTALTLPAIEKLRARGYWFTQHHIASCVCTPARSVLYTGQHVPHTKMSDNINFAFVADMDPSIKTLGHHLEALGYYSAYKGKWHLSDIATSKTDPSCAQAPTTEALVPYGFRDYNECGDEHGKMLSGATHDGDTRDAAVAWLEQKAPALQQPWFLAVNFVNPHDIMFYDTDGVGPLNSIQKSSTQVPLTPAPKRAPYDATHPIALPPTLAESFDGRPAGHAEHRRLFDEVFGKIPEDHPELWENYLSYYANCHLDVDARIDEVLAALERAGKASDTIVVFTADHGELGGVHGVRQKGGFIYRENTNVPFVIVHPDKPGGVEVPALMSAVDLVPTVLGLAGADLAAVKAAHPELVGHDLSGLLDRPEDPGPRATTGLLFTYDGLSTVDADFAIANASPLANTPGQSCAATPLDTSKRGFVRAVYDGKHRFARWFSPVEFNTPGSVEELLAMNDVELLLAGAGANSDTHLPPTSPDHAATLDAMRAKLEALIAAEIGADGYVMPEITVC